MRPAALLAVLAILGYALPAASQGPTTPFVVDANGKSLGRVLDLPNPTVALEVNGVVITVIVFRDHLQGLGVEVLFSGANCSGAAYVRLPEASGELHAPSAIIGPNNSLYLGPRAVAANLPYASHWINAAPACDNTPGVGMDVVPVEHALDLTPTYIPPFSFQAIGASVAVPTANRWALVLLAAALAAAAILLLLRRP